MRVMNPEVQAEGAEMVGMEGTRVGEEDAGEVEGEVVVVVEGVADMAVVAAVANTEDNGIGAEASQNSEEVRT